MGVDDIINTKHDNERLVILHHNEQAQPLDDAERSQGQLKIAQSMSIEVSFAMPQAEQWFLTFINTTMNNDGTAISQLAWSPPH